MRHSCLNSFMVIVIVIAYLVDNFQNLSVHANLQAADAPSLFVLVPARWNRFAQDTSANSEEMEENFTKNLMSLAIIVAATFDVAVAFYLIGRITSPFLPPPQFCTVCVCIQHHVD